MYEIDFSLRPVEEVCEDVVDVFISYSAGDENYVCEIIYCLDEISRCLELPRPITYCTDINDKHGLDAHCICGSVARLIEGCNVYVHIGNEHANTSENAFRKVHYAVDLIENVAKEVRQKSVITLLDDDPHNVLPSSLMFLLSNVNHRQKSQGVFPVLIKDITRQLGLESKTVSTQSKYDVFISYSHNDSDDADRLAMLLEDYGISYFMYENDISGGENYLEEISFAIDSCSAFAFVGSPSSYTSKYTLKELFYAVARKGVERVVLCGIDGITPEVELLTQGAHVSDLNRAIAKLHDLSRAPVTRSLKKGEISLIGNQCGVSYETGKLGHAIAVDEQCCQWCLDTALVKKTPLGIDVPAFEDWSGTDGEVDGFRNRRAFKKFPVAEKMFPAYGYCAKMGAIWHLPSSVELESFYVYFNEILESSDVSPLKEDVFYWSSSECSDDIEYAWGCVFVRDSKGRLKAKLERRKKTEYGMVRAMIYFGL